MEQTLPIQWDDVDERIRDLVREALEWLDANAPGRAREILIEALGK